MNISLPFSEYKRFKLSTGDYSESEFDVIELQYNNISSKFNMVSNLVDNDRHVAQEMISDLDFCIQNVEDIYTRQTFECELVTLNTLIHFVGHKDEPI